MKALDWNFSLFNQDTTQLLRTITVGLVHGMEQANAQWESFYPPRHLQKRGPDSTGPRTRGLLEAHAPKVTRRGNAVESWRGFEGDDKLQMVASVLEKGATIRPKRPGGYLKFKLERRYSRRAWTFPDKDQWLSVKKVVIPPYLHFEERFLERVPDDFRIIGRELSEVLNRGGFI